MDLTLWILAGVLILAPLVIIVLTFVPAYRAATARQTARNVGLALPAGQEQAFEEKFASRTRASSVGGFVGTILVIAALLTGLIPSQEPPLFGGVAELWLVIGGFYVGMGIGSAVRALSTRNPIPTGERFARSEAVSVRDYLAPIDLVGGRVAVLAGVIVLALASIITFIALGFTPTNPLFSVGGLVVLLGAVSLIVFETAGRRILNRAQPVASPGDLAWDDAIRAMTVREIISAPLSLGVWGSIAIGVTMGNSLGGDNFAWVGVLVVNILVIILGVGILVAAIYSIATKPQQHYLRRLWPDVAAQGAALESAHRAEVAAAAGRISR